MISRIKKVIVSVSLLFSVSYGCPPNPTAQAQIIASICYECMLPISIGGIQLAQGPMPDPMGAVSSPVCICRDPFPRVGIPVSFFEPSRMIEVVSTPFCFPAFGTPSSPQPNLSGTRGKNGGDGESNTFAQAHYMIYPVYSILELITDLLCLEVTGVDFAYITEVDPLWQSDTLAAFMQPEALLFANPISQIACIADSVSSAVYFPNDALFWCMGSWGNAYPLTGSLNSTGDFIQDYAGIAARMIYKLHRQLVLWGSWGQAGLCGYYPQPIWRKTAYRLQILIPIPHPIGTTIGQTGHVWSFGKDVPITNDNAVFMLFKKRDCCVL